MLSSKEAQVTYVAKYCPFSSVVCHYWPFKEARNPVEPMLKVLVAAAEVALDRDVRSVLVNANDVHEPGHGMLREDVLSSLSNMGVNGYNRIGLDVPNIAWALGLEGECDVPLGALPSDPEYREDPAQLIMGVEFSRAAMTTALYSEECGVFDMIGSVHSTKLGQDAMQACRNSSGSSRSFDDPFMEALRSVSKKSKLNENRTMGSVLVFGEQANNEAMLSMLSQVLQEQYSNGDSVDLTKVKSLSPGPTFAGSRAAAWLEWEAKERIAEAKAAGEL